ncbi:transporter substrate-binding domain-containing protein [Oculatella sp. LEGE 06141]|uniref:transporter substrate-binding domain-containing protein n=1 Tax=Oculatella sp. LEGE 06141 TaxID=1828648 RepID=UPI00187FD560|nr:transporter substrate-binding domain-containing protein [Oculatella sp. LEGE 06141]MBE9179881.1 transporter substrate-binding domain-containing protein [Oculatella sp. LEGE 06141]
MLSFDFRQLEVQSICASICRIYRFNRWWGACTALVVGIPLIQPFPAVAADLQTIRQRGYLIVAVKDNVRPLGFRNAAGELEGFEIDLARRLAEALLDQPNAVRFEPVSNQARLSALLNDDVDVVIARFTATAARSRLVDFSIPYYIDGTAFVTSDPGIQAFRDLANRPVAVLEGSSTISTVRSLIPSVRLVGAGSYQAAYEQLEAGDAVAFAADSSVLTGWVQEYPSYRLLPTLISAEALSIALPKGVQYNELRQQVNSTLNQLWAEGWLQERIGYWGLPETGTSSFEPLSPVIDPDIRPVESP